MKRFSESSIICVGIIGLLFSCIQLSCDQRNANQQSEKPITSIDSVVINTSKYADRLAGFWLGQCIANWTGLVTEMDKIGNIGEIQTGAFYTRDNWGGPDQPNIWSPGKVSDISDTIDFVLVGQDSIWGADDDTDIEYMYQYLMAQAPSPFLTASEIRNGWLTHILPEEENYLWVSNQQALDLMKDGLEPPLTGSPEHNQHYDMIDAQLTTEFFGLLVPGHPSVALELAYLPIRTSASENALAIAEFYVVLHSLLADEDLSSFSKDLLFAQVQEAKSILPDSTYPIKMLDYVWNQYRAGISWEACRDSIYQKYQVRQEDGYDITGQILYCNGCFAAGINYAASLISLFYGEGDFKETIKIAVLCGWDSDNPAATWGGLLGFIYGYNAIQKLYGQNLSEQFNIHRTRQGFPNNGIDDFKSMAESGINIIGRILEERNIGQVDYAEGKLIIKK